MYYSCLLLTKRFLCNWLKSPECGGGVQDSASIAHLGAAENRNPPKDKNLNYLRNIFFIFVVDLLFALAMADGVRWSRTGMFASLEQASDIDEGEEAQNKAIKSRTPHNSRLSDASVRKVTEYSLRDSTSVLQGEHYWINDAEENIQANTQSPRITSLDRDTRSSLQRNILKVLKGLEARFC
jgi:hypothetical protein